MQDHINTKVHYGTNKRWTKQNYIYLFFSKMYDRL